MGNQHLRIPLPDDDVIIAAYNESSSLNELCEKLGPPIPNKRRLRPVLERLGLPTEAKSFPLRKKQGYNKKVSERRRRESLERFEREILPLLFLPNCPLCPKVARRTIAQWNKLFKWLPYQCECGNRGNWRGSKMTLQLDHKNGVSSDNRLENLRWLCPNCHSQTDSFCGRNSSSRRKAIRAEIENGQEYKI